MTPKNVSKLQHLQWAVGSRTRNQQCAVHLLRLFMEYEAQWKTRRWARAAQDLLAVSFSLWRAAFLADKTAKRTAVFSHATEFLEKIIEDNAISYVQDRKCNEWTFNYYTRNARASLEMLNKYWPNEVPSYVGRKRTPVERWDYCQELLNKAVKGFEIAAESILTKQGATRKGRETRLAAKVRKRKSRAITIAQRSKGG